MILIEYKTFRYYIPLEFLTERQKKNFREYLKQICYSVLGQFSNSKAKDLKVWASYQSCNLIGNYWDREFRIRNTWLRVEKLQDLY